MSSATVMDAVWLEQLSALADGELEADAASSTCACWRTESSARATWHAYHLIGDVLRSDDLAADPARDAAFIGALRSRLAAEPRVVDFRAGHADDGIDEWPASAVVAAANLPARTGSWRWKAASAIAAGFVLVAGGLMLMRAVDPGSPATQIAARGDGATGSGNAMDRSLRDGPAGAGSVLTTGTIVANANGALLRDARLDNYLAAHKQFAGSSALGVPSAFVRSATVEGPAAR